jgi:hypothetical protein
MIQVAKLVTGEMVLGKLDEEGNLTDVLSILLMRVEGQRKLVAKPAGFMQPFVPGKVRLIKEAHIVHSVEAPDDVKDLYTREIHGISLAKTIPPGPFPQGKM